MIYILLIFQLQRRILISNFHTCIDVMVFRNTPNEYSALLTGKEKVLKIVLQSLFCLLFIDWKHILAPLLQETVILIPNLHPLYFVDKRAWIWYICTQVISCCIYWYIVLFLLGCSFENDILNFEFLLCNCRLRNQKDRGNKTCYTGTIKLSTF